MLLLAVITGELGCLSVITYILPPSPSVVPTPHHVFSNTLYLQHVRTAAGMQDPKEAISKLPHC